MTAEVFQRREWLAVELLLTQQAHPMLLLLTQQAR
jgi:hypothetical protein